MNVIDEEVGGAALPAEAAEVAEVATGGQPIDLVDVGNAFGPRSPYR